MSSVHAFGGVAHLLLTIVIAASCDAEPRDASWDYIAPAILSPNCATASCHSPAAAAAGLDFSTAESGYLSLTSLWIWIEDLAGDGERCRVVDGVRMCQHLRQLVNPYNPAQSRLLHVLEAQAAPRMPPDRPLPASDIALIELWILEGAHEHAGELDGAR